MKKTTVTIGIPAYNEEANIAYLLEDLLKQNTSGFVLEKILVISDGSTDKTEEIVGTFSENNVQVIRGIKRHGLSTVQNQIFERSDSDILVLLNADIMINDIKFLEMLIQPIRENKAELTCCAMSELKSPAFIGKVLNTSMKFKTAVFEKHNNGNNLYTCHGTARAFSKKLYKEMEFKDSIGEDAYSYLYTLFNNYRYSYVHSTEALYRLPTNLRDHERQSIRFIQSKSKFNKEFGEKFVSDNYVLPKRLLLVTALHYILKYPVYMLSYIFIYYGLRIKSVGATSVNNKWEIAKSSKVLRAK